MVGDRLLPRRAVSIPTVTAPIAASVPKCQGHLLGTSVSRARPTATLRAGSERIDTLPGLRISDAAQSTSSARLSSRTVVAPPALSKRW